MVGFGPDAQGGAIGLDRFADEGGTVGTAGARTLFLQCIGEIVLR